MRLVMYVVAMGMVGSADVNQLQIDEVLMVLHSAVLDVLKDEVQIDVATSFLAFAPICLLWLTAMLSFKSDLANPESLFPVLLL